ncbi:MAG: 2TM domain-containing protein [Rhizobacter sp.]|jgi:hypothetical protein
MNHPTLSPEALSLHRIARRRVAIKTGWMVHALVFVAVNLGLFVINGLAGGFRWHLFPLGGWGLGLAIHGLVVLLVLGNWRERLVAREVERLRVPTAR